MTTELKKPVSRRTTSPHRGRRVVVTIAPGDVIGFREERTRKTYWITLGACFDMAVKIEVARIKAEKHKARKGRRSARLVVQE